MPKEQRLLQVVFPCVSCGTCSELAADLMACYDETSCSSSKIAEALQIFWQMQIVEWSGRQMEGRIQRGFLGNVVQILRRLLKSK